MRLKAPNKTRWALDLVSWVRSIQESAFKKRALLVDVHRVHVREIQHAFNELSGFFLAQSFVQFIP